MNVDQTAVIVDDQRVVGYAVIEANMINLLMIDTDFHRRGYGSALLEHV